MFVWPLLFKKNIKLKKHGNANVEKCWFNAQAEKLLRLILVKYVLEKNAACHNFDKKGRGCHLLFFQQLHGLIQHRIFLV